MQKPSFVMLRDMLPLTSTDPKKSVSASELCWAMRPYIAIHPVKMTAKSFILPTNSQLYRSVNINNLEEDKFPLSENIIYFSDVIHVTEFRDSLEILSGQGYLYLFSRSTSHRKIIDLYPDKNCPATSRPNQLRKIVGSYILFSWWRLRESITRLL